jgi:hypothetical protein
VEPEFGELTEQAQVKEFTNLVWIKASLGAFNRHPCLLFLSLGLCFTLIVHSVYWSCMVS